MSEDDWHPTGDGFIAGGPMHPVDYLRRVSAGHFPVLVITTEKPTHAVLRIALAPFGPDELGDQAKWHWWTFGGRFTGALICYDVDCDTMIGGLVVPPREECIARLILPAVGPDCEIEMLAIDRDVRRPGRVDACKGNNLIETMVDIKATVDNGFWFAGNGCKRTGVSLEPPNVRRIRRGSGDLNDKWLAVVDCYC